MVWEASPIHRSLSTDCTVWGRLPAFLPVSCPISTAKTQQCHLHRTRNWTLSTGTINSPATSVFAVFTTVHLQLFTNEAFYRRQTLSLLFVCLPPWRPGKEETLNRRDHCASGAEPGSICMGHPCVQSIMCTLGFPGVPKQNSRRPGWCFLSSVTQAEHPQRGFSMHEDLLCSVRCLLCRG